MSPQKHIEPEPEPEEKADPRLIERPDGYYWQDAYSEKLFGPFATSLEALEDMQYRDDSDYEEGESLREAEDEIGISGWVDPETGGLSESSAPHLSDE